MKNQKNSDYFVSLDIGTNSVGYAVTDKDYNLMKYQQHPMWGVHLFDEAQLAQERRTHRASRRRLDRRQQRVQLLRELFALQIGMVDKYFFERIDRSSCKKSSDELPYAIFADSDYTDRNFYRQYPTIHHLIAELIDSNQPHDIRLVYLACAWLVVHRGHFFSDVAKERIDEITNFTAVYQEMEDFLAEQGYTFSWKNSNVDINHIGNILKSAKSRTAKHTELAEYLHVKEKKKKDDNEAQLNEDEFLALLSGKVAMLKESEVL